MIEKIFSFRRGETVCENAPRPAVGTIRCGGRRLAGTHPILHDPKQHLIRIRRGRRSLFEYIRSHSLQYKRVEDRPIVDSPKINHKLTRSSVKSINSTRVHKHNKLSLRIPTHHINRLRRHQHVIPKQSIHSTLFLVVSC